MNILKEIYYNLKDKTDRRDKILMLISVAAIVITISLAVFSPIDLKQYAGLGYFGIIVFLAVNSAATFSPIPSYILPIFAATFLDPILVVVAAATGAMLGEVTKYFFGDGIDKVVNEYGWHKRLKRWFYFSPFLFLVIWIALPNPIQSLGNVFAGSARYPLWKYMLASFLGNAIWMALMVWLGTWLLDQEAFSQFFN